MEHTIVIPFDFSESARHALKNAVDLYDKMRASIHVVHVASDKLTEAERKRIETDLIILQNRNADKCNLVVKLFFGPVGGNILDYASTLSSPVIFICKSGKSDDKKNYTGPNAHYIVANAVCPVLFLKTDLDFNKINTILVPLDLNFENKLKLGYAMFLSRFFGNATIRLLSVVYDADDYGLNKLMIRLNHLNIFFDKMGINNVGEIIRCFEEDGEHYSKVAVDYAEKSEAELILLMTNEEKSKPGDGISLDSDYMLSHFRNNVLSITPFVKN
ncbi:MAG: universal stress protein [Bacteroidia bacterium]|nr:universal stress protein [Bacteroidia bacterium]